MCRTMIGSQKYRIISLAYFIIKESKKVSKVLVQSEIVIFNLQTVNSKLMADIVRRRQAKRKKVGRIRFVFTQLFVFDSLLRKVQADRVSERRGAQQAQSVLF